MGAFVHLSTFESTLSGAASHILSLGLEAQHRPIISQRIEYNHIDVL